MPRPQSVRQFLMAEGPGMDSRPVSASRRGRLRNNWPRFSALERADWDGVLRLLTGKAVLQPRRCSLCRELLWGLTGSVDHMEQRHGMFTTEADILNADVRRERAAG